MEKVLAAIHQANHLRQPMSLEFGTQAGRVALFLRSLHKMEEFIVGPITANYPNCSITTVEQNAPCPIEWETWTAELELAPELFPIPRHAQFEDMLNRNFADPINGILRAIKPDEQMRCRIEIVVSPAKPRRCHKAAHAVQRLDREFFRHHYRLSRYCVLHITRPHGCFFRECLASSRGDPQTRHEQRSKPRPTMLENLLLRMLYIVRRVIIPASESESSQPPRSPCPLSSIEICNPIKSSRQSNSSNGGLVKGFPIRACA